MCDMRGAKGQTSHLICDWFIQMEATVIDDIISLESSLNDEFLTMMDSGLQIATTVKLTGLN